MIGNIWLKIKAHKIITGIIIVILLVSGYSGYKALTNKAGVTTYAIGTVARGTIISSLSGTGSVAATDQVELKPGASANVTGVYATVGQAVTAGTLLVQLDAKNAVNSLHDAQANLENAQLSYEKLVGPVDVLSKAQAQSALVSAQNTLANLQQSQPIDYQKAVDNEKNAESDLAKAYDDSFSNISTTFVDLPTVIAGLNDLINGNTIDRNSANIDVYVNSVPDHTGKMVELRSGVIANYNIARKLYDKNFSDYKATSRSSDTATIESLLTETSNTTKAISDAVKSMSDLIQYYKDDLINLTYSPRAIADTHLATLNSYLSKVNGFLVNLTSAENNITSGKQSVIDTKNAILKLDQSNPQALIAAKESVQEKELSLQKVMAGAETIDIKSQQLAVIQKQRAVSDAASALSDYSVRAPFDGIVAKVSVKKGDSATSGTSAVTLITKKQLANVSLNEIDVAKVKVGQKATVTFDAIDGLSISGEIIQVDALGTVSQGVATYNVQIGFDTNDDRVKSGMSVTASIILEAKPDVIMVNNTAVKSANGTYYVLMPNETVAASLVDTNTGVVLAAQPKQQVVEIGIANDTDTEITSGLNEGDQIVTKTIAPSVASAASSSGTSILSTLGGNNRGGSATGVRVPTATGR